MKKSRNIWFAASCCAAVAVLVGSSCGEQNPPTEASLTVKASPRDIAADGLASSALTITATDATGAPGSGSVALSSQAGTFDQTVVQLSGGVGNAIFKCDAATDPKCAGLVRITGDWNGVTGSTSITVGGPPDAGGGGGGGGGTDGGVSAPPSQVTWASTKCNGQECVVMGIKGSGVEKAVVSFKVTDSAAKPVANQRVCFELQGPPTGTTASPAGTGDCAGMSEALTDAMGVASTTVTAGPTRGAFTVKAIVVAGTVEGISPTIGIRGVKPTNKGFAFSCQVVNLEAYAHPTPPVEILVSCQLKLVDRQGNPIGTGTPVFLFAEAGTIGTSLATVAYKPQGDNQTEGSAVTLYSTKGVFPAVDVSPLAADPTQFPNPREAEPFINDGALVRNPRDGLVTLVAYVQGEEWYDDTNNNGKWDTGESFVDQGEVFVDSNDNNVWDPGETYVDESPSNGKWDPPNGVHDASKNVWTEAHVLLTGRPVGQYFRLGTDATNFAPKCPGGIPEGQSVTVSLRTPDLNLNRPSAIDYKANFASSSMSLAVTVPTGSLGDGFGFELQRLFVDSSAKPTCKLGDNCTSEAPQPGTVCSNTSARCEGVTRFFGNSGNATWSYGHTRDVTLKNTTMVGSGCIDAFIDVFTLIKTDMSTVERFEGGLL